MQCELSIIIVSYNAKDLLDRCLASIVNSNTNVSYELIVVDNDSHDGSIELVRSKYAGVLLLANQINVGFARANNQGLVACTGRYALLLNSDTEVLNGALETMHAYMQSHPEAGILGPQLLNSDRSLQPSGNKVPSLGVEILQMLPIRKLFGIPATNRFYDPRRDYSKTADVDEVSGASLMVRRAVWEKIGLLDEGFFFYFEDTDFCIRARRAGWKVIYVPSAQVLHHWGSSTNPADPQWASRMLVGYYYFIRKVHGTAAEVIMRAVVIVLAICKILVGAVGAVLKSARYRQLAMLNRHLLWTSLGLRAGEPNPRPPSAAT